MSNTDPRIEVSEDELEDGEIRSDSELDNEGEILSDSEGGEVIDDGDDDASEEFAGPGFNESDQNLETFEGELEEGEIISDAEDDGTGAIWSGTGTFNGEAGEREKEVSSLSGHEQHEEFEGDDEGLLPDREVDEEGLNNEVNDNDDDESLAGTDEPPSSDAVEPATDDEWNHYADVIQEQEIHVRKFNIIGYQVEFAVSEDLVNAENLPETLERLIQRKIDESEEKALEAGFEVGWLGMAFFVEDMDHEFLVPFRPKR